MTLHHLPKRAHIVRIHVNNKDKSKHEELWPSANDALRVTCVRVTPLVTETVISHSFLNGISQETARWKALCMAHRMRAMAEAMRLMPCLNFVAAAAGSLTKGSASVTQVKTRIPRAASARNVYFIEMYTRTKRGITWDGQSPEVRAMPVSDMSDPLAARTFDQPYLRPETAESPYQSRV